MMSYRLKDNRGKKKKWFFVIFLLFLLFFYSNITNFLQKTLQVFIYPVWITENYLDENTINPFGFLASKKELLVFNEELKKDLVEAELMLVDRGVLLKENLELKEILGRSGNIENTVLVAILAKPNRSLYDTLIVDAGKNLDIKKGDKVFALGNVLIGVVDEVDEKTSKVKLFSSQQEKIDVTLGFYNINVIAVGKGGGNFEIRLPRDTEVDVGEIVTMSGFNSPVLGSIEEIISDPVDPFKTLLFKSPVNMFELKWVQILKSE